MTTHLNPRVFGHIETVYVEWLGQLATYFGHRWPQSQRLLDHVRRVLEFGQILHFDRLFGAEHSIQLVAQLDETMRISTERLNAKRQRVGRCLVASDEKGDEIINQILDVKRIFVFFFQNEKRSDS